MAQIRERILNQYGIDLDQENILKLYKCEQPDADQGTVEEAIEKTRRRWQLSIQGANEKNARRDQARMEKARAYEAILRDPGLRKAVYTYYYKEALQGEDSSFAKAYFTLIGDTKNITGQDVDFFFSYFPGESRNKRAILEMLKKEFRLSDLGKGEGENQPDQELGISGGAKIEEGPLIVNLFQKNTLLRLRRCTELLEMAAGNPLVCSRYPQVKEGLFGFLQLDQFSQTMELSHYAEGQLKEVYSLRQERGSDFTPLVDLFNTLRALAGYRDVADNFAAFKMLVQYPALTPYMYSVVEMKPKTLQEMGEIAVSQSGFADAKDFILNYYLNMYHHFGISNARVEGLLRRVQQKTLSHAFVQWAGKLLGRERKPLPLVGEILFGLAYWPVYLVYLIFELLRFLFRNMEKVSIPLAVLAFFAVNFFGPRISGMPNLLYLRYVFMPATWKEFLARFFSSPETPLEYGVQTLGAGLLLLGMYLLPTLFVWLFVKEAAANMNKGFDWIGYQRTLSQIVGRIREREKVRHENKISGEMPKRLLWGVFNLVSAGIFCILIFLSIRGMGALRPQISALLARGGAFAGSILPGGGKEPEESTREDLQEMVITAEAANIRSGPGTDQDVLTVAQAGTVFLATGETSQTGENVWYQIYLDGERTQTGWASDKVIGFADTGGDGS